MIIYDLQVFGNSGTRPFREVAAEADTPRRSNSGVTYDQGPAAVPAKFRPVEVLANAMHEVKTASDRSEALVQMVIQIDEVSERKYMRAHHC